MGRTIPIGQLDIKSLIVTRSLLVGPCSWPLVDSNIIYLVSVLVG